MEELISLVERINNDGYATEPGCSVSVRDIKGMVTTKSGVAFDNFDASGIEIISRVSNVNKEYAIHLSIYQAFPHAKVIMRLKPLFTNAASKLNITPRSSTELVAEVIGKKLGMSTSIPSRIIECLVKERECLIMNGGILLVGQTLEETYARAKMIERAVFTYMTVKAVAKRLSSNRIPCETLYKERVLRGSDYTYSSDKNCIVLGQDKLFSEIRSIDEDNKYIYSVMPIFVGIFAHSDLELESVESIPYENLSNKKYCYTVAKAVNKTGAIILKGRGLVVCDEENDEALGRIAVIEKSCKDKVIAILERECSKQDIVGTDIINLFAAKIAQK